MFTTILKVVFQTNLASRFSNRKTTTQESQALLAKKNISQRNTTRTIYSSHFSPLNPTSFLNKAKNITLGNLEQNINALTPENKNDEPALPLYSSSYKQFCKIAGYNSYFHFSPSTINSSLLEQKDHNERIEAFLSLPSEATLTQPSLFVVNSKKSPAKNPSSEKKAQIIETAKNLTEQIERIINKTPDRKENSEQIKAPSNLPSQNTAPLSPFLFVEEESFLQALNSFETMTRLDEHKNKLESSLKQAYEKLISHLTTLKTYAADNRKEQEFKAQAQKLTGIITNLQNNTIPQRLADIYKIDKKEAKKAMSEHFHASISEITTHSFASSNLVEKAKKTLYKHTNPIMHLIKELHCAAESIEEHKKQYNSDHKSLEAKLNLLLEQKGSISEEVVKNLIQKAASNPSSYSGLVELLKANNLLTDLQKQQIFDIYQGPVEMRFDEIMTLLNFVELAFDKQYNFGKRCSTDCKEALEHLEEARKRIQQDPELQEYLKLNPTKKTEFQKLYEKINQPNSNLFFKTA